MDYLKRIARVQARMKEKDVDFLVVGPSGDAEYLVGMRRPRPDGTDHYYPGEWLHLVVLGQEGLPTVIVPYMASRTLRPMLEGQPHVGEFIALPEHVDFFDYGRKVLDRFDLGGKTVALGYRLLTRTVLTLQGWYDARWVPANDIMEPVRAIKDPEELEVLAEAGAIADRVFADVVRFLKKGVTEEDVAAEIWRLSWLHGSEGTSFATGVTFTKEGWSHPGSPVTRLTKTKLENGMTISFDFGVLHRGYSYDFGRTVFVGEPDAERKKVHALVMGAQAEAAKIMAAGRIRCCDVDARARGILTEAGYGDGFTHRLGHGIGIDVHEPPFLTRLDTTVLQTGMCFTVEPSIRYPGRFAIRVEDVLVVTPEGGRFLSHYSRDLTIVEV